MLSVVRRTKYNQNDSMIVPLQRWLVAQGVDVRFGTRVTDVDFTNSPQRRRATCLQILITAGDNPDRLRSEAAFAHLCGVAPIPASSGRTHRHRLNGGGDRRANNALYLVVLGRLRYDSRTRAYAAGRTTEGLSKAEIIRCLKHYVAREIFTVLTARAAGDQSHTAQTMSTAA